MVIGFSAVIAIDRIENTIFVPNQAVFSDSSGDWVLVAVTGRLDALATLSVSQWAWLALTGCLLSVFVSVWFAAVARAQVIDVAAVLVVGAVITGLINLGAGGTIVATQLVGWVLISVAAIVFIAGDVVSGRRTALGSGS